MKTLYLFFSIVIIFGCNNVFSQSNRIGYQSYPNYILLDSLSSMQNKIKNIETNLKLSDSINFKMFVSLSRAIESNKKIVDDSRLRESLKAAETTIEFQNNFIQIFEVIFGAIALFSGFLYFFSFRPSMNQAEKSIERTNSAIDKLETKIEKFNEDVDVKIKNRFELFEKKTIDKNIEEIFTDLESRLQNQRKIQVEKLTTLQASVFTSERIDRLFKILDQNIISDYEKLIITEVLIQIDNFQTQKYFESWCNVKNEEVEIIDLLYKYYMTKGMGKFLNPIRKYILSKVEPHLEFIRLLDMLPSHPDNIYILINSQELIGTLDDYKKKYIKEYIQKNLDSWNLLDKSKVDSSYLFRV